MPKLFNLDHEPKVISWTEKAVMPGESYEFTDEQIAAGLAGSWSAHDPRKPSRRDHKAPAKAAQTQPAEPEKE